MSTIESIKHSIDKLTQSHDWLNEDPDFLFIAESATLLAEKRWPKFNAEYLPSPVVVNFFGGPGTGKSTMAATLFASLKKDTEKAELVTEFARDLVYSERIKLLKHNQLYVLAKQYERVQRLVGKADIVVTDSPLLLSNVYPEPDSTFDVEIFRVLVRYISSQFNNLNYYLPRPDEKMFIDMGRIHQSKEEASKYDSLILTELADAGVGVCILEDRTDVGVAKIRMEIEQAKELSRTWKNTVSD